jgi:hypothetical protein
MNINLGPTPEPNFGETMESMQDEIEEHIEIMRRANPLPGYTGRTMLLSDPEYPGAYRVWLEYKAKGEIQRRGQEPTWVWVTPEGEVINSQRPWGVTA